MSVVTFFVLDSQEDSKVEFLVQGEVERVARDATQIDQVAAGESFVTHVSTDRVGYIAVKVSLPKVSRYDEGTSIIVPISRLVKGFVNTSLLI